MADLASVGGTFAHTVTNGSLLLALPVAAIAGLVSFASPCVLPLVPGYLSYVTGMSGADLTDGARQAAPEPHARRQRAVRARASAWCSCSSRPPSTT